MTKEAKIVVKTPTKKESQSKKKMWIILSAICLTIVAIGSLTMAPDVKVETKVRKSDFIDLTPGENSDWRTEMQMSYKAIVRTNEELVANSEQKIKIAEQVFSELSDFKNQIANEVASIGKKIKEIEEKQSNGKIIYKNAGQNTNTDNNDFEPDEDTIEARIQKQLMAEKQAKNNANKNDQPLADSILPPPPGMPYSKARKIGETSNVDTLTQLKPSTSKNKSTMVFSAVDSNYLEDRNSVATESVYVKNEYAGFIPMGSFAKVALLSGLDSGTSEYTRANPQPVLMRVQGNAQLPQGKYKTKSCFVLGSSYGDLSSERVYVQVSRISCVDKNKGMMLTGSIQGFLADADSTQGLKGKVIRRSGQLIGKSMLAGFASGLSSVAAQAGTSQVTTVTGAINSTLDTDRILETGGLEGAGQTLDAIAKQYMDEAKNMFPVISVAGGRVGTMILTQGTNLEWKSYRGKYEKHTTPSSLKNSTILGI